MNMIEIDCFDLQENSIDHFSQWDMDQKIYMKDWECDYIPMFHFSNKKSTEALVVKGVRENDGRISANVPNILLQEHYPLIVYIYLEDDDSSQTVRCIKIPVRKRPKPNDYSYVENIEYINWVKLEKQLLDFIDELESTGNTAKDHADRAEKAADSVDEKISNKGDNLEFDSNTNLLYLTSNGRRVSNGISVSANNNVVEVTQAEYDALGDVVKTDDKIYYVKDNDTGLGKIMKNGIAYGASGDKSSNISYDNANSGLSSSDVQNAIDEVAEIASKASTFSGLKTPDSNSIAYLTGSVSSIENTETEVFDTGVYLTDQDGQLHVKSLKIGGCVFTFDEEKQMTVISFN